jgi:hypothetical protein
LDENYLSSATFVDFDLNFIVYFFRNLPQMTHLEKWTLSSPLLVSMKMSFMPSPQLSRLEKTAHSFAYVVIMSIGHVKIVLFLVPARTYNKCRPQIKFISHFLPLD